MTALARIVAALAVTAAFAVGTTSPASALSCAAPPAGVPRAVASGDDDVYPGFFEDFDFAVVATVTDIETDETAGSPTYGATTIDADVALILGEPGATDTIALSASDPGWMAGYSFRVGRTYFVPVDAEGPDGQVNYTFLCTPIYEVDDADATADRLAALATDAGVVHARPGDVAPTTVVDDTAEDDASSSPLIALATGVAVLLGASAIAVIVRSRRRSSAAERTTR
jgi:hypothetical protein